MDTIPGFEPTPVLARFFTGYEPDGVSKDGFPQFKDVVKIQIDRPPNLQVIREADEADIEVFHEAYEVFLKKAEARKKTTGFPLTMWPAITPAMFELLAARNIDTVEQLAKLTSRKDGSVPPQVMEMAERAKAYVQLQGQTGKYEEMIKQRDSEIAALKEQVEDFKAKMSALRAQVDALRRVA